MKHYLKFRGEWLWFTDLGLRIAANDLINNICECLKEYENRAVRIPASQRKGRSNQ